MLVLTKAILAIMIGFIIAVIFGLIAIPLLRRIAKQKVSTYLERKHHDKDGTPTMGGIIFIIPTIVATIILLFMGKIEFSPNLLIVMFVFLSYAGLGFIDDFLIIKRKNNVGLTEFQKLAGQLVIALIFFAIYMHGGAEPVLDAYTLGFKIDMGWFYGIFLLFVLVASSNAVNITDGLDGLAGGLSVMAFLAFALISWNSGAISGTEDIAIFCFVLVGSLLGFLVYNTHPAKVFMGDTGSLALGGFVSGMAFMLKMPIFIVIIAFIYLIEALSDIIQVFWFKYTKKKYGEGRRVFKMAPLHHHFQESGYAETQVVAAFAIVTAILCLIAYVAM